MNWPGLVLTDSGGFQVFSLGAAMGKGVTKVATEEQINDYIPEAPDLADENGGLGKLATIDEDGVTFKSYKDGTLHRFTPERSMEIQWNLGADMIFAFDECTSPMDPYDYQKQAMDRTHRWALRSLTRHNELDSEKKQALLGVVQGGRFEDLRAESAKALAEMKTDKGDMFDGFGIGGSFTKNDLGKTLQIVNAILPEDKPRHLLGIGEPIDFFFGVENGCDTFDCVAPTRNARHGALYHGNIIKKGNWLEFISEKNQSRILIKKSIYAKDENPILAECLCYTCQHFTRAYLHFLFKQGSSLYNQLACNHNIHIMHNVCEQIRRLILDE